MNSIPAGTFIVASLGKVRELLFSPFSPGRWLRFVLIAFLAGSLSGGCGVDAVRKARPKSPARQASPAAAAQPGGEKADPLRQKAAEASHSQYRFVDSIFRPDPSSFPKISPFWLAAVVIPFFLLLFLALFALWFFGIWLSVRFKFMWLHAVREGEAGIRALFYKCRKEAEDLLDFWLGFSALEALSYAAVIAWLFLAVYNAGDRGRSAVEWTPQSAWALLSPPLGALLVVWLFFSIGRVVGDDFLVPLASAHPGTSREIWRRWTGIYRRQRARVWLYLFLRAILSLPWGIFQGALIVALLAAGILIWIAGLGLFGWTAKTALFLKPFYAPYALLTGVPLAAFLAAGIGAALLPAAIFFRDFSVRVLERLEPA